MTNHWKIMKNHAFFTKVIFFWKKKAPGRAAPNRRPNWDAPNPSFPIQTPISNENPSKHQIIESKRSAAEAAACKFGEAVSWISGMSGNGKKRIIKFAALP